MLAKKGAPTDRARTKYTKLNRREAAVKVSRASERASERADAERSAPNARKGDRDLVSPRSRAKGGAVRAKGARRQAKRDSR